MPSNETGDRSSLLRVRNLVKMFRREDNSIVPAIDHVSFDVSPGEFVVLLGPSGCGKTTLLRSVAGLEHPDSGLIELHGNPVFDSAAGINLMPEARSVGMVFQSYALWPHMSAFENVAYPLHSRHVAAKEIPERVHNALRMVGIPELASQFPSQMSGGQQQRIALARAIVANDKLVLFDEPLSNVDAKVREQLRIELLEMQSKLRFAALYVTHDQTEAMALAHRVAVIRKGKIEQIAPPRDVYERPNSRYVANFIGTTNEIEGTVEAASNDNKLVVNSDLGKLSAVSAVPDLEAGKRVALVFRPERCEVSLAEPASPNRWRAVVEAALFLGSHTEHILRVGNRTFLAWGMGSDLIERGTDVWLSVPARFVRALPSD
jgi:iron(III) transport system ATP-binding protein